MLASSQIVTVMFRKIQVMKKKTEITDVHLKETKKIIFSSERSTWIDDPQVSNYIYFSESEPDEPLTAFKRYYEIYEDNRLVGDIKVFYDSEQDIMQQRGQILMVVGERNRGIGTAALSLLLEKMRGNYKSAYCEILRTNVASLKILKRNGFAIDRIDGQNLILSHDLI